MKNVQLAVDGDPLMAQAQTLAASLLTECEVIARKAAPANADLSDDKVAQVTLSAAIQMLFNGITERPTVSNEAIVMALGDAVGSFLSMTGLEPRMRPMALGHLTAVALQAAISFDQNTDGFETRGSC